MRIPSQTGDEGSAQDAVARLMRAHDLEVDIWEPDVTQLEPHANPSPSTVDLPGDRMSSGVWRGQGRGRSLILNGHIDTVEVGDPAAWSHAHLVETLSTGASTAAAPAT